MKEKLINGLKWLFKSFIWLGVLLLAIDIITKQVIMHTLHEPGANNYFDWGFVHINYVLNDGAAFGMGLSDSVINRVIYLVVATLISIGLVTYLIIKRKQTKLFVRAALVMVVTGAIGNMIDRVFYGPLQGETGLFTGRVVDWIDFYWFWGYIFNIADCCIVIAAFMLIVYVIVEEVKDYRAKNKTEIKPVDAPKKTLSKSEMEKLEMNKPQEKEDEQ